MSVDVERPPIDREAYPEVIRHNLQWCTGPCGRITRSSKYRKYLAPDTVNRESNGMCQQCKNGIDVPALDPAEAARLKEATDEEARKKLEATLTSLADFMVERRERIAARRAEQRRRRMA